jgi:hypothetical protein
MDVTENAGLPSQRWIIGRKQLTQDYLSLSLLAFGFTTSDEVAGDQKQSHDIGEN